MKEYTTPSIQTMKTLSFETVCAGSGVIRCPYDKTAVDSASFQCQLCIDSRFPWQPIFDAAGGNDQEGRIKGVKDSVAQVGYCPGGLTNVI